MSVVDTAPVGQRAPAPVGNRLRTPSSAQLVRMVAGREISTRIRDKSFLISSLVMVLLILGLLVFQVISSSSSEPTRIGVVGGSPSIGSFLEQQGVTSGTEVQVVQVADTRALGTDLEDGDVDAGLDLSDGTPRVVYQESADPSLTSIVQGAVAAESTQEQLLAAGVRLESPPLVQVVELDPQSEGSGQQVAIAAVGIFLIYFLLILFGQFVAQGVVEEKSSRVVELLLATMRPWHLLAGKILGLGVLGLLQVAVIAIAGLGGALAFDVLTVPGEAVGTVLSLFGWFVLAYALYASLFAAGASLVSRQEDLGSVLTPMSLLPVVGFIIALQAIDDPNSTLATVASYVPGISPLVMPVRTAAGAVAPWEVGLAVLLMLVAIAVVVRLGGRIYAGALLRTGGKLKYREALRAERV